MKKTCENCVHWKPFVGAGRVGEAVQPSNEGLCQCHPPVPLISHSEFDGAHGIAKCQGVWPCVQKHETCGDWKGGA